MHPAGIGLGCWAFWKGVLESVSETVGDACSGFQLGDLDQQLPNVTGSRSNKLKKKDV